jgi:hypothetical protein
MSSVHAVTTDLVFTVRVASFNPVPMEQLIKDFSEWVTAEGKAENFLVWQVRVEGKGENND